MYVAHVSVTNGLDLLSTPVTSGKSTCGTLPDEIQGLALSTLSFERLVFFRII